MNLITINFVIAFVAICYQSVSANTKINSHEPVEETEASIQLKKFVFADLFVSSQCSKGCEIKSEQFAVETIFCKDNITNLSAATCEFGWVLNWDEADLGKNANVTSCASSISGLGENHECSPCICGTTDIAYSSGLQDEHGMLTKFSLKPQESDITDNMVVTGLRFRRKRSIIYLQIQQAQLLSNGEVDGTRTWKNPDVVKNIFNLEKADDSMNGPFDHYFLQLQYDIRTMFLDKILLPENYIVTGVKFTRVTQFTGLYGLRMEVKGTKFDSSYRLITGTDKWFSIDDVTAKDDSYDRPRTEIPLNNCSDPDLATNNKEIGDSNRLVRFRATDMEKDFSKHIIPYFSGESAENNKPLRGIEISYKGQEGFGGYIIAKVYSR